MDRSTLIEEAGESPHAGPYEELMARHVASFVHMVTEGGKSYTAAWEVIKARTLLQDKLLASLCDRCVSAANDAKSPPV